MSTLRQKQQLDVRIPKLISTLKTILQKYNIEYVSLNTNDNLIRNLATTGYGSIQYDIIVKVAGRPTIQPLLSHTFTFREFGGCCGAAVMIGIDNLIANNTPMSDLGINIADRKEIIKLIFSYIFMQLRRKAVHFKENHLTNGLGVISLHLNTTNIHVRELLLEMEGEIQEYAVGENPKTGRTIYFFCTYPHLDK
jgi:hypothetical protein